MNFAYVTTYRTANKLLLCVEVISCQSVHGTIASAKVAHRLGDILFLAYSHEHRESACLTPAKSGIST